MENFFEILGIAATLVFTICVWVNLVRLGYPAIWGILLLVPIINVIFYLFVTAGISPLEKELQAYRRKYGLLDELYRSRLDKKEERSEICIDSGPKQHTECISCGKKIPAGRVKCPECGWSYK